MKKLVILNGDATYNRGDRAILAATLNMIKSAIPNVEITIFSYEPKRDAKWYKVKVVDRGIRGLWERIQAVYKADLILWGGGVLLQDNTSKVKIPFWVSIIMFVKLMGKPVMGYAQGIGPLNTRMGKFLTCFIVNRTDIFTVRDEHSKELLESIGVDKTKVIASVDPAVNLKPAEPERIHEILREEGIDKGDKTLIGIAPRRWFHMSGSFIPHKYAVKYKLRPIPGEAEFEKLKTSIAKIADHLIERVDARIIFIPMYPISYEGDDKVGEEIIKKMKHKENAKVLKGEYPPDEFMGIIGQTDLFLGVRLHSTILATAMNVPSITFSYVPKGISYFKMINQRKRAINIEELIQGNKLESVISTIDETWDNRERIKKELKQKIEVLQKHALSYIDLVLKLL